MLGLWEKYIIFRTPPPFIQNLKADNSTTGLYFQGVVGTSRLEIQIAIWKRIN